jgi:type IV pilus assembly protein PilP
MKRLWVVMAACSLLTACGGEDDELRQWMVDVRKEIRPTTSVINEPRTFEPFLYDDRDRLDPFDQAKLANALRKLAAKSNNGLAPDMNRRKEPLEGFPLDALGMVGYLVRGGQRTALVKAEGVIYEVRVGNYVGENFGLVTKISDSDITLKEVVQDASGEWVERISTLELQEGKK